MNSAPVSHPFNSGAYDQPEYKGPLTSYIICSAPRSGSTLLASLLNKTGQMGVAHEYFNRDTIVPYLCNRWKLQGNVKLSTYVDEVIKRRTTPNGHFALKVHARQFAPLSEQKSIRSLMKTVQLFVRIRRRDHVAQAVSYAMADQTQEWSSLQPAQQNALYDDKRIEFFLDQILDQEKYWQKFFAINQITPFDVFYEDLLKDANAICTPICRKMGVEVNIPFALEQSPLKRQFGPLNQVWIERFIKSRKLLP